MIDTPELGAPYCWTPFAFTEHNSGVAGMLGAAVRVSGRIVYINAEHRFFRVEGRCEGGTIRECFKF